MKVKFSGIILLLIFWVGLCIRRPMSGKRERKIEKSEENNRNDEVRTEPVEEIANKV